MIPHSYGSAIHRFCGVTVVESADRRCRADLDSRVVRSHIRCLGNLSRLSIAQFADLARALIGA